MPACGDATNVCQLKGGVVRTSHTGASPFPLTKVHVEHVHDDDDISKIKIKKASNYAVFIPLLRTPFKIALAYL